MYNRVATIDVKEVLKYRNTDQYRGMEKNNAKNISYTVEADEYGYRHYKKGRKGIEWTHRIEGPAIIYRSGTVKYFIDGQEYTEAEHQNYKELHHAYGYPNYYTIDGVYYTEEELAFKLAEQKALEE